MAYEEAGSGEPVLLVHAGICDRRMWEPQLPALTARHRVIRPDLPGYGDSPGPGRDLRLWESLAELIETVAGGPAHMVGASFGGVAAIDLTLQRPDLVRSLTAVGIGPGGLPQPPELMEIDRVWDELHAAGDLEGLNELDLRTWVDGPRRSPDDVDPGVRATVREMNAALLARPDDGSRLIRLDPPACDRLGEISCPVLAVVGDEDQPYAVNGGRVLAAGVPNGRLEVITGTAHLPNMERPEEFSRILLDFLAVAPAQ
jgi:pimeloyl-ACP methyl ester carboxylesterase